MKKLLLLTCTLLCAYGVTAQYSTKFVSKLINDRPYKYIVAESSGERAKNNASDMSGYERYNRDFENLFESRYIYDKCREYGLQGAEICRYPRASKVWSAVKGQLWLVEPGVRKLADIGDIPAALSPNSQDADLTAQLIWVGNASERDLNGIDLKGKIAVGDVPVRQLHSTVAPKGAAGVISIFNSNPYIDPIQIPNSSISADLAKKTGTFAFQISPREGQFLIRALKRGQKLTAKANVKVKESTMEYQSPTCYIAGSDPDAGEIIFSAHLFEGYTKLGANDNMSGSVVLLEVARTLNKLIEEGLLERPKRTIRFIWGDEFSGIIPWVKENRTIMDKALFDINMDMVGIGLSKQKSYYHIHRTTMANSHYVNDLAENIFRYMGMTNQNSILTGDFIDPVIAPSGSRDPFYYSITSHYGASDHEVFNDWGTQVPAIMMITWPDEKYHTSADRVEELDATQLKRAAVISASVAYFAAAAGENEALKIGAEVAGNSLRRLATIHNRVSVEMNMSPDILQALKKAEFQVDAVAIAEKMTIRSIKELVSGSKKLDKYISQQSEVIDNYADILKTSLRSAAEAKGLQTGYKLTDLEKKAAKIYPASTAKVSETGYGVLSRSFTDTYGDKGYAKLRSYKVGDAYEAARLTRDGDKSVLDIYKMLLAQSSRPTDLASLMEYMEELRKQGLVN